MASFVSHAHGSSISTPCSDPACSWGTWLLFPTVLMSLSGASACSKGGIKAQSAGTSHPRPRGSGRPKSSLGHCGQHLIPSEWFSTLRPAREGRRQLNLPTACLTSWLQPAGDSFPQGGCQHLSWGTLRLSVPAVWPEVLSASENLQMKSTRGRLWGKSPACGARSLSCLSALSVTGMTVPGIHCPCHVRGPESLTSEQATSSWTQSPYSWWPVCPLLPGRTAGSTRLSLQPLLQPRCPGPRTGGRLSSGK